MGAIYAPKPRFISKNNSQLNNFFDQFNKNDTNFQIIKDLKTATSSSNQKITGYTVF